MKDRKKLFVLNGHDNQYKTTVTAVAKFFLDKKFSGISTNDTTNINNLTKNIEVYKDREVEFVYHFADNPKRLYAEISGNKEFLNPKNRLAKEILRKQFVKWTEYQKKVFGDNVWARKVVNQINKKVNSKGYQTFWIGDLRFKAELEEIQKNIHKNVDVEFIWIDTCKTQELYYKQDNINTKNFQHKITIDSSLEYSRIVESIYWQLKDIL